MTSLPTALSLQLCLMKLCKILFLIAAIGALVLLQVYGRALPVTISFLGYTVQISIYTLCALVLLRWLIGLIVSAISGVFAKFKQRDVNESIEKISVAILTNNVKNLNVVPQFESIKTALLAKNNVAIGRSFTGIKEVDIFLVKNELALQIANRNYEAAVEIVNDVIAHNCQNISVIQNEILELAKCAKAENIPFPFNPKKSKYNLSPSIISQFPGCTG